MFKDRTIQIGLSKQPTTAQDEKADNTLVFDVGYVMERLAKKIAFGVAAYVILDTCRQVSIAKAMKEVTK